VSQQHTPCVLLSFHTVHCTLISSSFRCHSRIYVRKTYEMISRHVGGAGARTVAVLVLLAVVSSSCDGRSQEPGLAWTADSCVSCGKSSFPTPSACVVSNTTIDPAAPGCCLDRAALDLLSKLLGVLRGAALTATAAAVDAGDSPFGAAVLDAGQGHAVLHADANKIQSSRSPMAHGEVSTINSYFATQPPLPPPERTVFLSTHQPCSICLSSLAFSGFRRVTLTPASFFVYSSNGVFCRHTYTATTSTNSTALTSNSSVAVLCASSSHAPVAGRPLYYAIRD
jgi:tRNA(Arg) A34 adenosine deaminase TadA